MLQPSAVSQIRAATRPHEVLGDMLSKFLSFPLVVYRMINAHTCSVAGAIARRRMFGNP
jgi:hypothetical protein